MNSPNRDFLRIRDYLSTARRLWKTVTVAEGLLTLLIYILCVLAVGFAVDNLFHLPAAARTLIVCVGSAAGLSIILKRILHPLFGKLNDLCVASHVEKSFPELENRLINAVQLQSESVAHDLPSRAKGFADLQTADALFETAQVDLKKSTSGFKIRRYVRMAVIALLVLLAYAALLPKYFSNAFQRYTHPASYIAPITDTTLTVKPGDHAALSGDNVVIEAFTTGTMPKNVTILFRTKDGDGKIEKEMSFEGNAFAYEFENVSSDIKYRVLAGDAKSPNYTITVKTRPAIAKLTVEYKYPTYLGFADKIGKNSAGNVTAVIGTRITLKAESTKRLKKAALLIDGEEAQSMILAKENIAAGTFVVEKSSAYVIKLEDTSGIESRDPMKRQINALPDNPPAVTITSPGKDVTVPPVAEIPISIKMTDDFGVRNAAVRYRKNQESDWSDVQKWNYPPGKEAVRKDYILKLAKYDLQDGDILTYFAEVSDGKERPDENAGRSKEYRIRIISNEQMELAAKREAAELIEALKKILEVQKANFGRTERMKSRADNSAKNILTNYAVKSMFTRLLDVTIENQTAIRAETTAVIEGSQNASLRPALDALTSLTSNEMLTVIKELTDVRAEKNNKGISQELGLALTTEQKIIAAIEKIIASASGTGKESTDLARERDEDKKKDAIEEQEVETAEEEIKKLVEELKDFIEEQEKVITSTAELEKKPVEDFTEEDQEMTDKLADTESEWAKFFKEANTDLSKVPEQDFSNPSVSEELVEVYSEVERAADALSKKKMEIAVPLEQAGLELAEEITANLEKWLPDTPDTIKWSMEERIQDYDVPLVDLPEELEDLIGDLIDSEDDMTEDVEDVSSSWMDSLDKGAGWSVEDGPISNMSAVGKTGNRLPNNQEVGGRSGEGRTGKSHGQFVEESATGKGGRQTPTRLTEDPWEQGAVKDTSKDPTGGATGGGKMSGGGLEGLRGPTPPALKKQLQRLAGKQAEIRNKAERLNHGLKVYRYPRGNLDDSIDLMKRVEHDLKAERFRDYAATHRLILSNLRDVKSLVEHQKQINRDASLKIPKRIRDEITAAMAEKAPEEYKELLNEYYKVLSNVK